MTENTRVIMVSAKYLEKASRVMQEVRQEMKNDSIGIYDGFWQRVKEEEEEWLDILDEIELVLAMDINTIIYFGLKGGRGKVGRVTRTR